MSEDSQDMAHIDAEGLHIRYREWGEDRPGDPLILIHGAGTGSIIWLDVGKQLGAVRRTLALDLPGHGQSTPLPGSISVEAYCDALTIFCHTLGIDSAILCGHSMGGAIALRSALAWPDRVSALVLCATGARLTVGLHLLGLIKEQFTALPKLLEAVAYSPSTAPDIVSRWSQTVLQAPPELVLADYMACDAFDVREQLAELRLPALIIGAADDLLTPSKYSTYMAEHIEGSRLLLMDQVGHNLMHEKPDEFVQAIVSFLSGRAQN